MVVEHPEIFYDIVSDISSQTEGMSGDFILSKDYEPISLYKNAEIITQFVPFTANSKELLNKVYSFLGKEAVSETMIGRTYDLMSEIEIYIKELIDSVSVDLEAVPANDISGLLKMFNVRFSDIDKSLPERLLDYMDASYVFLKRRVFFTVNLRSYINNDFTELFFRDVISREITLICIENYEHKKCSYETRLIVDNDGCVI